jgi:hypothetical protein
MTKTTINNNYRRILLNSPKLRRMIADARGVTLVTATNWVANENPCLTEYDTLNLLATYFDVAPEKLIKTEKINQSSCE